MTTRQSVFPKARSRNPGSECVERACPRVSGRGRGDLYVSVQVQVPDKLSREQKELVEQLDKTMPQKSSEPHVRSDAEDRPFFDRVKDIFG